MAEESLVGLCALPGGDLVQRGLEDLRAERETIDALLVAAAGARLRDLGLAVPDNVVEGAELRLYRALCLQEPDAAYSRYQGLRRRLMSFTRALERERGAALRANARGHSSP